MPVWLVVVLQAVIPSRVAASATGRRYLMANSFWMSLKVSIARCVPLHCRLGSCSQYVRRFRFGKVEAFLGLDGFLQLTVKRYDGGAYKEVFSCFEP